jgi:hypothetical protein
MKALLYVHQIENEPGGMERITAVAFPAILCYESQYPASGWDCQIKEQRR